LLTDDLGDLLPLASRLLADRIAPELDDPYLAGQLQAIARLLDVVGHAWPRVLSEGTWTADAAGQVLRAVRDGGDSRAAASPEALVSQAGHLPSAIEREAYELVQSLLSDPNDDSAAARKRIRSGLAEVFGRLGTIFTPGTAPAPRRDTAPPDKAAAGATAPRPETEEP
jgi:hypothetical protein